ncbi:dTDP-4-dehydrorhamnose reductase [Granulicella rosea]|uniref:dTDP-4-dehydrorhamnose reductase n=1 Tax=Granulicella rosea TaxID=474952 RepID=A0A239M3Z5_9BACT|nr:dTDP-4-dehydrorhamnose reductase [Granulicella rosea]SNT37300.1 dTDP-4-dehydrorhamnose reductase [Granulicella rosea]
MNRILITGSAGQVGGELVRTLAPLGEILAPRRAELDLTDAESIRAYVRQAKPTWIVNPAAYTAVDKAESEPELAYAVNEHAVRVLGEEARTFGAPVLHFSTDYVFSGEGAKPYIETDATGPTSVYGASKLAGERALAETGAAHLIFRTSWVYGATGKNFLLTILRLARDRDQMKIVGDQHGAPTWARDLARMTAHVLKTRDRNAIATANGIYHAAGAGETTWHGFADEIVRLRREQEPGAKFAEMLSIPTSEYPTPARRPANSRLDCGKLERDLGWRMMDWRDSLRQVMAEL